MRSFFLPLMFAWMALVPTQAADGWRPLFNGRDLDGWTTWLARPHPSMELAGEARDADGRFLQPIGAKRDPFAIFTVVESDGRPAMRITGQVFGEIRTTEEFENYHLRLQFKWGEKKWPPRDKVVRDSGLLYHVHSPHFHKNRTWPSSVELQIQEQDTGDLWVINSQIAVTARVQAETPRRLYIYDPEGAPVTFAEGTPIGPRCIKLSDHEKPFGEWNTVELIVLGDESIHIVNGVVVMRLKQGERLDGAAPAPLTRGQIALQSEGAEIFYRDIELRPIEAIPPAFAQR